MRHFSEVVALALKDHEAGELAQVLSECRSRPIDEIASTPDDRVLSLMAYRVFCSGFSRAQIDAKWPAFEEAFWRFAPERCAAIDEPDLDALLANKAIVRNGAKIASVSENARWILQLGKRHGSAARFFAEWPEDRYVELLDLMKREGSRLGGESGMQFLRSLGKPAFVLTKEVIAALTREGVIASPPTSRAQMNAIQTAMNGWSAETGYDLTAISRYLAWSVGRAHPMPASGGKKINQSVRRRPA